MENLKCSVKDCKRKKESFKNLNTKELEKIMENCQTCGNWILKDTKEANETYNFLCGIWSEKKNLKN